MISLVSIPHTGTKFLEAILTDMGLETRHAHLHSTHPAQNAREWVSGGGQVVIPWRDPELVKISAENRQETPRPDSEFDEVLEFAELPNVHLFDVAPGTPEGKEEELLKLKMFLGGDPQTDWQPVNESEDVTGRKAAYVSGLAKLMKERGVDWSG